MAWGVLGDSLAVEKDVAQDHSRQAKDTPNGNGQEDQGRLSQGEVVDSLKCIWHPSEEAEECPKLRRHVKADEGNDRLGKEHVDWASECHNEECMKPSSERNGWRINIGAILASQTALDNWIVRFPAEGCRDHRQDGHEYERPLSPAPTFADDDKGADDRSGLIVSLFC